MSNPPPWSPDHARAAGASVTGAAGTVIDASADISNGPDEFRIIGLPESGTRETRDRVRAAIVFPVKSTC